GLFAKPPTAILPASGDVAPAPAPHIRHVHAPAALGRPEVLLRWFHGIESTAAGDGDVGRPFLARRRRRLALNGTAGIQSPFTFSSKASRSAAHYRCAESLKQIIQLPPTAIGKGKNILPSRREGS
ncbi:hypothetical protein EJB05_42129, partial [Eragrostis curvula]